MNQVYRPMRQLNNLRTVCKLHVGDKVLTNLVGCRRNENFWDSVMVFRQCSIHDVEIYLKTLSKSTRRVVQAGKVLGEHDYSLAIAPLNRLKVGPSPGEDGVMASVYQMLREVFLPQMHMTVKKIFNIGTIPSNRVTGLINSVPKVFGIPHVSQVRPIALQNVILKWFSNVLFLMIEPFVDYLVPLSQKGSIRGRKIFDHISDTVVGWQHMDQGALLSVDFSKAYDTMQFNFYKGVFNLMGILEFSPRSSSTAAR